LDKVSLDLWLSILTAKQCSFCCFLYPSGFTAAHDPNNNKKGGYNEYKRAVFIVKILDTHGSNV